MPKRKSAMDDQPQSPTPVLRCSRVPKLWLKVEAHDDASGVPNYLWLEFAMDLKSTLTLIREMLAEAEFKGLKLESIRAPFEVAGWGGDDDFVANLAYVELAVTKSGFYFEAASHGCAHPVWTETLEFDEFAEFLAKGKGDWVSDDYVKELAQEDGHALA